jgi:sirohydrochlorin ferrochelatase
MSAVAFNTPAVVLVAPATSAPAYAHALHELAGKVSALAGFPVKTAFLSRADEDSTALGKIIAAAGVGDAGVGTAGTSAAAAAGAGAVCVVPLFISHFQEPEFFATHGIRCAPPIASADCDGHERLARILAANATPLLPPATATATAATAAAAAPAPLLLLVDHGNADAANLPLRESLARRTQTLLSEAAAKAAAATSPSATVPAAATVHTCSMRPFPGAPGPFLADLLNAPALQNVATVVLPQFLFPGRHAGPSGDIEKICAAAQSRFPARRICVAPLIGEHPDFARLIADKAARLAR